MKTQIKELIAGFFLLIGMQQANAQLVLSQYNNESEISAPSSVTLVNGFHATGNVRIFTTGVSYRNCDAQISNLSNDQNYILTRTFRDSGVNNTNIGTIRSICGENQTIQYFDGLGRPLQTVQLNGTLSGHDLVQPFGYDAFGRETIKYQPYSVWQNKGAYRADAISGGGQAGYYNNPPTGIKATGNPFSLTVFEASPLNRVLEQGAPGDAWQPVANSNAGHTLKMEYGTNTNDEVKLWQINSAGDGAVASVYLPGTLYKTISKDENWKAEDLKAGTTEEFKDFDGRVVLKRIWESDTKSLSTYYIYDDLGNLLYVLPPAVNENGQNFVNSFNETQGVFNEFIYGYHYDGQKRLVEKKIPGKGWEFMVYNKLDQVTHTQDANQRTNSQWSWLKYDSFGRVVLSGVENSQPIGRIGMQQYNDGIAPQWEERSNAYPEGYTRNTHPAAGEENTNIIFHSINYYDDYDFPGNSFGEPNSSQAPQERTKSLLTGTKVRNLGNGNLLLTVNYYDLEGRVLQIKSMNHLNGTDITDNSWNFDGSLKSSIRSNGLGGVNTKIATRNEYDHWGRKLATFGKINDQGEVTLSHLVYNELGQLKQKGLHSDTQLTTFTYNERGWMKNSSSNEFSMELKYNDGTAPQYNGNISNQLYTNGTSNTFTYSYDKLNRMIQSAAANNLGESISYDVMGNISSLSRDGFGTNHYKSYNGNQLDSIRGFTNSNYVYDANGNLISDSQKNINLSYNYLNLLQNINGSQNISYTYDATGNKLAKNNNGNIRNYVDGIEYNGSVIDIIHTEEGIAQNNGGTYTYHYNLSDHLGNVRYTFDIYNGAVRRLQQDDYYAFGLRKASVGGTNKYLYNGKELQEELGQYDYGARFYDPVVARWNIVDPLAEVGRRWSPYVYGFDNPVYFVDPDGMWPGPGFFGSFFRGVREGFVSSFTATVSAVRHPINTYNKMSKMDIARATILAGPNVIYGNVKDQFNGVKAIYNGDGKSLGNIVGAKGFTAATILATEGSASAVSKGVTSVRVRALTKEVNSAAKEMNSAGRNPATIVGAELNGQTSIGTSGNPPTSIAPQLEVASENLGGVGVKTSSGNTIGCCGEFRSANDLLLKNLNAKPADINFTPAIRPRTGQVVPMCSNCQIIFKK